MTDVTSDALDRMNKKDENAYKEFTASLEEGCCKKGQFLHEIHRISNKMYILNTGIVKQFRYKEDGSEHTTWFGFKGDTVIPYKSFVRQKPSDEGIKVLEDCTYFSISRDTCYKLAAKYHVVDSFFREMLESYYIESQERTYFLLALSAKQKYEYLLKHHTHFIQKLPSCEISAFIGISRETLSRIRKYS